MISPTNYDVHQPSNKSISELVILVPRKFDSYLNSAIPIKFFTTITKIARHLDILGKTQWANNLNQCK